MNKEKVTETIRDIVWRCETTSPLDEPYFRQNSERLKANISAVDKSFSGSWLGYHAHVYYRGFRRPEPGDHFSVEWGLMERLTDLYRENDTGWQEMTDDQVKDLIFKGIDVNFPERLKDVRQKAEPLFEACQRDLSTLMDIILEKEDSQALRKMREELAKIRGVVSASKFIEAMCPRGQVQTRDSTAASQGYRTPPHLGVEAWYLAEISAFQGLIELRKCALALMKYMEIHDMIDSRSTGKREHIFIGHGGSPIWRELKDFLEGRLHLKTEEFNSECAAGMPTVERLQQMMDNACFAFIVMTGEDQHADHARHARENVIHEAGLFQGCLGFRKAIILLEEGCAEFTNIEGLTQIRFPNGNISAKFEEIRRVLEREGTTGSR